MQLLEIGGKKVMHIDEKESIIDDIRFDFWQKLIQEENKTHKISFEDMSYAIFVDENLIRLFCKGNDDDTHYPDILIYFRRECFVIYVEDTDLWDFGFSEESGATHIVVASNRAECINFRDTEAENFFRKKLHKAMTKGSEDA